MCWLSTCLINSLSVLISVILITELVSHFHVNSEPCHQTNLGVIPRRALFSESRLGTDLPAKPGTPSSSSPPASVQPGPHPGWPESHLKLWNCIPFSSPIDSGAVSKTNGGFRKSILMKEKKQGKERYLEKGGGG